MTVLRPGDNLQVRGTQPAGGSEFSPAEAGILGRYLTNLDGRVFALRNLPEVVMGALFSRYSRTEKRLPRVLLDEFLADPEAGLQHAEGPDPESAVSSERAEAFYARVLVGYGDDSVAELAGAHLAVERVSTLAAKALEDPRIGLSPLEKSTRYVRFDRPGLDGRHLYHRGPELAHPEYEPAMEELFGTYSRLVMPLTERLRERFPLEPGETERAWKTATRARALDLLRGLLPASTLTNLGLYGNGRAFEYLLTKLSASELPECRELAGEMHAELSKVIPAFVRRGLDDRYGVPAAARMVETRRRLSELAPPRRGRPSDVEVRLVGCDRDAERTVAAALLFPHSDLPLAVLRDAELDGVDLDRVLEAALSGRTNRRQRTPRALEHVNYTFEITANFGAYRDLQRHRMLTQDRQLLGTSLGWDLPRELSEHGMAEPFRRAVQEAAEAHHRLESELGPVLAQYAVPLAFRLRWYAHVNLREVYHLCELRTSPQGHPDYRLVAQEMFRRVQEVHPRLAAYATFVDLSPGDELGRRASERRIDDKLAQLGNT
ncbi:MAG: FAD-dependent thymidylate synthase [Candidatus Dormibacteraeota bacterium]|nr:FAD-dependent thymidylate synthase [Candidatus Dormibacteraeota bacterium]